MGKKLFNLSLGHDFNASIHRRMPLPRGCVIGGWYACGTVRQRCRDAIILRLFNCFPSILDFLGSYFDTDERYFDT